MAESDLVSGSAPAQPTKLTLRTQRKEKIDQLVRLLHHSEKDPTLQTVLGVELAKQCDLADQEGLLDRGFIERSREFIPIPQHRSNIPKVPEEVSELFVETTLQSMTVMNSCWAGEE